MAGIPVLRALGRWLTDVGPGCCPDAETRGHRLRRHPVRLPLTWLWLAVAYAPEVLAAWWRDRRGADHG